MCEKVGDEEVLVNFSPKLSERASYEKKTTDVNNDHTFLGNNFI